MSYPVSDPALFSQVFGLIVIHVIVLVLFVCFCEWLSRKLHDPARCKPHQFEGESFHDMRCIKCGQFYSQIKHQQKADVYAKSVAKKFAEQNQKAKPAKKSKWRGRLR